MKYVLIVEDSSAEAYFVQRALTTDGRLSITVQTGPDALETFRSEDIVAVITDYNLPGMTGAELAEFVHTRHPLVPVILLTGGLMEGHAVNLRVFDAILVKPVDRAELIFTLAKVQAKRLAPVA